MIITSQKLFFESEKKVDKKKSFWNKKITLNKSELLSSNSSNIYEGSFQKKQKQLSGTVTRYYYYNELNNTLYYSNTEKSNKIIGFQDLINCYADFLKLKDSYVIQLRKQGAILQMITQNQKMHDKWKRIFRQKCFLLDFELQYSILKLIGRGTFAKVFLAECKNGNQYAVKTFSKENIQSKANGIECLRNEINLMQQLKHPNVLNLLEVYESSCNIYLIVDLITGGELIQRIQEKKKLKVDEVKTIMKSLIETIQFIHSKGVMHRDLKPQNILLKTKTCDLYDLVIADFGLAQRLDSTQILYPKCGTPGYVAPEVLDQQKTSSLSYGCKVDIFSLGVILVYLLTGKHPFKEGTINETLKKNKQCIIAFQGIELSNEIETQLVIDLIKKMTEKNPENRYTAEQCLKHQFFKCKGDSLSQQELCKQLTNQVNSVSQLLVHSNSQLCSNSQSNKNNQGFYFAKVYSDDLNPDSKKESSQYSQSKDLVWIKPAINGNISSINSCSIQVDELSDHAQYKRRSTLRKKSAFCQQNNNNITNNNNQILSINQIQVDESSISGKKNWVSNNKLIRSDSLLKSALIKQHDNKSNNQSENGISPQNAQEEDKKSDDLQFQVQLSYSSISEQQKILKQNTSKFSKSSLKIQNEEQNEEDNEEEEESDNEINEFLSKEEEIQLKNKLSQIPIFVNNKLSFNQQ